MEAIAVDVYRLSDADLVRAAQAGEAGSLGLLFERYRAPLHALALGILGYGPQAQDAVHDTFLIALIRLDTLQDPAAVGAWLRAVTRNVCFEMIRRSAKTVPLDALAPDTLPSALPSLEEQIDQLALREWVWTALAALPETLRVTAMLRYFGDRSSYEHIALVLGVPIGTIKSRMNQVKIKLAEALLATADLDHTGARRRSVEATDYFTAATSQMNRDGDYAMFADAFADDPAMFLPDGTTLRGRGFLIEDLEGDMTAGVKMHLSHVYASTDITILEATFTNPPDNPTHCPPATTQVHFQRNGKTERVRLYFAPRPDPDDERERPGRAGTQPWME